MSEALIVFVSSHRATAMLNGSIIKLAQPLAVTVVEIATLTIPEQNRSILQAKVLGDPVHIRRLECEIRKAMSGQHAPLYNLNTFSPTARFEDPTVIEFTDLWNAGDWRQVSCADPALHRN